MAVKNKKLNLKDKYQYQHKRQDYTDRIKMFDDRLQLGRAVPA